MSGAAVLGLLSALLSALLAGAVLGAALGRRSRELTEKRLRSVTRLLFVSTQASALVWVFTSYAIAIYSTVRLRQVYTMEALSRPAIDTILGAAALKVLENIFEHNEGAVFGKSKTPETDAGGDAEGGLL